VKLETADQEFRNPRVFYPDPKNIDLDRVLINLFLLMRCNGSRPATRGRPKTNIEKVEHHTEQLAKMEGVEGFAENPAIAKAWLESDIFDVVNRGKSTQAVASLRPLHLNAHKIRVAKHCRDYNVADALYAMLSFGEKQVLSDLKEYLDLGRDPHTDRYDGKARLDIETLTVLKLVQDLPKHVPSNTDPVAPYEPICIGQSRVLCDDVQRLLAYRDVVPRPVMIDYLKTVFGLHVALYTLRLSRQLTGWLSDKRAHSACLSCPVSGHKDVPFDGCPYQQYLVVDMGGDYHSRMAYIAQESATAEYGRLIDLIKSLFAMNQLMRFARDNRRSDDPREMPSLLTEAGLALDQYFNIRLGELRTKNEVDDQTLSLEEEAIYGAGLAPFDTYIELITHARQKHHIKYLTEMMDKLLQKNTDNGALIQGKSVNNLRRWRLGGRLLEVLVQLAVLRWRDKSAGKAFYTEPILVEDFLRWIEARYGFVVTSPTFPEARRPVTVEEHRAFRENLRALKDRLREIGFYDDLSDAYNAQTIRPRYRLDSEGGNVNER
jgi:hypothetical protein